MPIIQKGSMITRTNALKFRKFRIFDFMFLLFKMV